MVDEDVPDELPDIGEELGLLPPAPPAAASPQEPPTKTAEVLVQLPRENRIRKVFYLLHTAY